MSWPTEVGSLYSLCSSQIVYLLTWFKSDIYSSFVKEEEYVCWEGESQTNMDKTNIGEQSRRRKVVCKTTLFWQLYFVVRADEDRKRMWFLKKSVFYFSISTLYRTKLLLLKKKHNITHTKDLIYNLKSCNCKVFLSSPY